MSTPTGRFNLEETSLMTATASLWEAREPWERFRRMTSTPALTSLSTISGELDAGPSVATILVFLLFNCFCFPSMVSILSPRRFFVNEIRFFCPQWRLKTNAGKAQDEEDEHQGGERYDPAREELNMYG